MIQLTKNKCLILLKESIIANIIKNIKISQLV